MCTLWQRKIPNPTGFRILAEKERFELSLRFTRTTPLAGEPLRPLGYFSTWSVLHKNGGERGIRTPGAFQHHWFSRPAPSTTRPSLRALRPTASSKCLTTISLLGLLVNPFFEILRRAANCFFVFLTATGYRQNGTPPVPRRFPAGPVPPWRSIPWRRGSGYGSGSRRADWPGWACRRAKGGSPFP